MHKYKVYTGPTIVGQTADRLRAAGYTVSEGTEHVYTEALNAGDVLRNLGLGWTHRDVQELS